MNSLHSLPPSTARACALLLAWYEEIDTWTTVPHGATSMVPLTLERGWTERDTHGRTRLTPDGRIALERYLERQREDRDVGQPTT